MPFRSSSSRTGTSREPVILVVDDEAVIRDLCAKVLKGYRVLEAEHGAAALDLLERQDIDIVLTDVMMPRLDGLELLRRIKERDPNRIVVVMTGYAEKEVILRALKADADDFISKPINLLQLQTTIDKVLEKKALKEELVHLRHSDRLKSDFLGLVSHKLKTPTTAISLFIQNLSRGITAPSDPDFDEGLRLIQQESDYLGYLIQDLLYYSEIILQEGPPQLEPTHLLELAQSVLNQVRPQVVGKGIELDCRLDDAPVAPLALDRRRISFALKALLDNAVKFTPAGGQVVLRSENTDDALVLTVADNGPGMSREELAKIFEKFYQVDPHRTGQVRGFGLGLFYARKFARDHGGFLAMTSEPGQGTRARLGLPLPGRTVGTS